MVVLCMSGVLLQYGCAFKDIDKRLFVSAIGIDPAENVENGYKVTLKVALPFGAIKDSERPSFAYLSREGQSIGEAIRMLETHVDKVLELGHMKTIIVHEKLLSDDMQSFMDYFIRRGDIQLIAYVAGARPSAETILKVEPNTEAPASVALINFFGATANDNPYVVTTYLFQLRRDILADGINPVLPLIETIAGGDELIVNNSVVVDKREDPAVLSAIDTKYFNSLLKDSTGFTYLVKEGSLKLLLNISQSKMTYQFVPSKGSGVPRAIDMHIMMKGTIGEANKDLSIAKLDDYNRLASKEVKQKVMHFLTKMQEENLDPFGFGLRYRATRLHTEDIFTTWQKAYPDIEFKVTVDVKLQGTGSIE
ncbi:MULTISPECIES: Ger(x)C family spore germination protein [unclassified Sporosarcina]|uniref:Ger(x)C family spore germination protein n=1 Tax=unclassified Sporosarcina TaxID=2647733 RepID=UPI0021010655|nr:MULTISPECIES: Ger(x)C family spore germination protein [unclassified Sporosarcina]